MNHTQLLETVNRSIETHAFSGVVSIRQGGQVIYEQAAGYADRSNKIANSVDTRFGIASGTKFFTALAIGKLIAAQKLTLSTRLQDCVALNFQHYAPEITIQHLLTHTSGIPDYYDEEKFPDFDTFFVGRPWYEMKGPKDYLAIFPDEPMKFSPGSQFSYANGGYILLGIDETVRGQRRVYVMGGDAGVSFNSSVRRAIDLQVTVLSNKTDGARSLLRDIAAAIDAGA